jgi:acetolactate synthase-1/2/3 large subunit
MPNQLLTLRSIFKHAARVESPGDAALLLALAFQAMHAGRPGPAAIEMPWDIFSRTAELGSPLVLPPLPAPPVDTDQVQKAARLIAASRAPMIFVGSGAVGAGEEILSLAERLQAPVIAFRSGRGIVSNAHELGLTIAEAYPLWGDTDVVIGIGTRLEIPRWRWPSGPSGQKTVRIDIDPAEMRRGLPDVGMVADARQGTLALIAALEREEGGARDRLPAIRRARATTAQQIRDIQPQVSYLEVLRRALPAESIVTDELSQVGFASWYAFPVYQPRTFISSGYQGNLGSGFPTALGAKVAFPSRPVVAICGDGGFMFGVQELATAAQFGINLIILLFNNNSYGNVLRDQMTGFSGRITGAILKNPDFIQLARAFDIRAERVGTPEQFSRVLHLAVGSDRPWLIEIAVETNAEVSPWRFIQPSRSPTP